MEYGLQLIDVTVINAFEIEFKDCYDLLVGVHD
jgi:hypothetical protein